MRERKKKVKLKNGRHVHKCQDVFLDDENGALEYPHGDRVVTTHIRQFESAKEEMVQAVWGANASTTQIIQNWENFILAQLLDAVHPPASTSVGNGNGESQDYRCETCLRGTANFFARSLQVTKVSSDSMTSTPMISGSGTPIQLRTPVNDVQIQLTNKVERKSLRPVSRPLRI